MFSNYICVHTYYCVIKRKIFYVVIFTASVSVPGIVVSVKKQAEKKIQREKRLRMACEKELSKYREYCATQEQEIELMKGLLLKHGIDLHESQSQPPEVSKKDIIADINLVAESEKAPPFPAETPPTGEHSDTPDTN